MPSRETVSGDLRWIGLPSNKIVPERRTVPEIARSVDVFPAPFAPRMATDSPSSTLRETPCSAWTPP